MQPKRLSKCSWNSLVSQKRDFILLNWKDLPSGRHLLVRTIVIILLLHQHHPAPIKSVTNGTELKGAYSLVCVCVCVICFTTAIFLTPFYDHNRNCICVRIYKKFRHTHILLNIPTNAWIISGRRIHWWQ